MKVAGFLVGCALAAATNALADSYPRVPFVFGYRPFDEDCEKWRNAKIEPEWYDELRAKAGALQDYWDREGTLLLKTTVAEIGKPFRYQEMIATLTLCPVSSISRPLLINVRGYLDGPTQNKPRPMEAFAEIVYHELLHTYVFNILPNARSALLVTKYKDEEPAVKTHVHLMAVMKLVYLKLGREEYLKEIVEKDSAGGPAYKRAWQIVNDIEGHQAFVEELKNAKD